MRILIAIHGIPPTYIGGAERAAERIIRWLVGQGHHVEVFAIERLDDPDFRLESTIDAMGVTYHRLYYDIKASADALYNTYNDHRVRRFFLSVLQSKSFDIVHVISGYLLGGQVLRAASDLGVPTAITLTEFWFICARLNLLQLDGTLCVGPETHEKCARCIMTDRRRFRIPMQITPRLSEGFWSIMQNSALTSSVAEAVSHRQQILRACLRRTDLIITPSRFLARKLSEFGLEILDYVHIPHGLDRPAQLARRTRRGATLRLGYIGQIKPHKGVDRVVTAVRQMIDAGADVTLDLWGPYNPASDFEADLLRSSMAYPAIRWNGAYGDRGVWDVLADLDVLVMPSRWYENAPTVILEAFAMGLPVVTTNLGGMAEMVQHERNGLLFELNSVADLRAQLMRLIREPGLVTRLEAGIPYVRTAHEEVADIFNHYERVIAQAARRRPADQ